jgi:hypothetical protein
MRRPGAHTRTFAEAGSACLVLAAMALGCGSGAERSATFAIKQEIPLGIISVTVMGWEEVPQIHPPFHSLDAPAGEKAIAVFARWRGLDEYAERDQGHFVESFLQHRLKIIDSEGYEASAINAMPRALYDSFEMRGLAPRDWVVIYHVWVDSQGYTLQVRHPDPGEEDFHVAVVPLD